MKHKSRIIEALKARWPKNNWRCERYGFGWRYVADGGWIGQFYSHLVSMHPDDMDGHAMSRFAVTGPNGFWQEVPEVNSGKIYTL